MRGTRTYAKGQTFRNPQASRLRAIYAANLRDLGFTYTAIAQALGLPAHTKERARRIVEYGYRVRDEAIDTFADLLDHAFRDSAGDGEPRDVAPDPCDHALYSPLVSEYRMFAGGNSAPYLGHFRRTQCGRCGATLELIQLDEQPAGRPASDEDGHTLRVGSAHDIIKDQRTIPR